MKKNNFIPFFVFLFLFFSCAPDCSKIVYNNGISTLNGKLYTGECDSYFPNGKLNSKQSYKNGKDDGEWVFYFSNGNLKTKGFFKEGIRIGDWEYYYENGQLWKEAHYVDGNKSGVWKTFNESGLLIEEITFEKSN